MTTIDFDSLPAKVLATEREQAQQAREAAALAAIQTIADRLGLDAAALADQLDVVEVRQELHVGPQRKDIWFEPLVILRRRGSRKKIYVRGKQAHTAMGDLFKRTGLSDIDLARRLAAN